MAPWPSLCGGVAKWSWQFYGEKDSKAQFFCLMRQIRKAMCGFVAKSGLCRNNLERKKGLFMVTADKSHIFASEKKNDEIKTHDYED